MFCETEYVLNIRSKVLKLLLLLKFITFTFCWIFEEVILRFERAKFKQIPQSQITHCNLVCLYFRGQPYKQHITEEKMAEHMARLHISSESVTSVKETATDRTKRLYMCEEMRKLQQDSILPQSILSRIHHPCTALVLWTPPRRIMPSDNSENNNEDSIPDHNRGSEVVMESDMNTMDLDNI